MKKTDSLSKTKKYQQVYKFGRSKSCRILVMVVRKNETERNRLGISVSKKVGNSVIRHRITRLIRESYRLHEEMLSSGLDIVVIARNPAKDASYYEVEEALLYLAKLHKIRV